MLLNISNHPNSTWDKNQYETAITMFGSITDYPFPEIEPSIGIDELILLSSEVFKEITKTYKTELSVHLMGEYVFCFHLAKLLENARIPCFVSTTERVVKYSKTRKKISLFGFVSFRPYYKIMNDEK